eukprot:gene28018-3454_t
MSNSFAALFGDDSDSDSEDGQPIKTAERRTASSVTAVRLSGDTTTTSTERRMAGASHMEGAYDADLDTVLSDLVEGYTKQEPPPQDAAAAAAAGIGHAGGGAGSDCDEWSGGGQSTAAAAVPKADDGLNSATRRKVARAAARKAAEEAAAVA